MAVQSASAVRVAAARSRRLSLLKASSIGFRSYGAAARAEHHRRGNQPTEPPMPQPNDLSRSRVPFEQDATIVAVVEMSHSSWLVAAIVPGLGRHPLKKVEPDREALLRLLERWRGEAAGARRPGRVGRSGARRWRSRPAATASGSRAGCGPRASRPT